MVAQKTKSISQPWAIIFKSDQSNLLIWLSFLNGRQLHQLPSVVCSRSPLLAVSWNFISHNRRALSNSQPNPPWNNTTPVDITHPPPQWSSQLINFAKEGVIIVLHKHRKHTNIAVPSHQKKHHMRAVVRIPSAFQDHHRTWVSP